MKKSILVFLLAMIAWGPVSARQQEPDTLITQAISLINADSLHSYIQQLQDMQTRFMMAPNRRDVATWIMQKFLSFGVPEARMDSFQCYTNFNYMEFHYDTTTWQYNVEARIEGVEVPEDEVVLLGHYDDFSQDGNPELFAPGADDNASGTAATLEIARVLMEMEYNPRQTVIFLASAAEELMYYGDAGTEHYASEAEAAGRNIIMAINNDMIGWDDGTWTLCLFNHTGSPHITTLAIDIIETYTSLGIESWDPVSTVGGDIQAFLDAGYPGIYFMEHYINPNYHSDEDLLDGCDMEYLAENTKVSLGCILESDLTVGTDEQSSNLPQARIYPNPTSGKLNIMIPREMEELTVTILNTLGEEVYFAGLSQGAQMIDLSGYPPGIYLAHLQYRNNAASMKIVLVETD